MKFVPIYLYVIAWLCAFINQHYVPGDFVNYLLTYVFLFSVGIGLLWGFVGHVFCPEKVAECMGRKTSDFQYEVGVAKLSFGVLGVLCFAYPALWVATAIGVVILGLGYAYGYLLHMIRSKDAGKCGGGAVPFMALVVALTLIIGMWMMHAHGMPMIK